MKTFISRGIGAKSRGSVEIGLVMLRWMRPPPHPLPPALRLLLLCGDGLLPRHSRGLRSVDGCDAFSHPLLAVRSSKKAHMLQCQLFRKRAAAELIHIRGRPSEVERHSPFHLMGAFCRAKLKGWHQPAVSLYCRLSISTCASVVPQS